MSLDLVDVSFVYDVGTPFERMALDGVSFSIEPGSFVGIAGSSGSGKTTLVKILKGLLKPSSGQVSLGSFCNVGLVFQYPEFQLFESTVLKDVMFGPVNLGFEAEAAKCMAIEALASLGLDSSFWVRDPLALSGGEKRRVAIAGVLSMNPHVLVLDEPAAGLDPTMHDLVFSLLLDLNRAGKTIVLVSHSMDDIAQYCNHVVYLKDGHVVADGTPSYVFSNREALDAGISKPSMASLANDLRNAGLPIPSGICTIDGLEKGLEELFCCDRCTKENKRVPKGQLKP